MANYDQPVTAAREASEAMRALAHATAKFGDRAQDTFDVLGDMLAITASFVAALEHLAQAHDRFIDRAVDDETRSAEQGRVFARSAAIRLRRAARDVGGMYQYVDGATAFSSRIIWSPAAVDAKRVDRPEPRRIAPSPHSEIAL